MVVDPSVIETPPVETPPPVAPPTRAPRASRAADPPPAETPGDDDEAFWARFDEQARTNPAFKERLKTHDVVAGIAGGIADTKLKLTQAENDRVAAAAAVEAERQALRDLARDDPDAFAARFLTQEQADEARRELDNLASKERQRIGSRLGRAYKEAPEFVSEPLSLSEYQALTQAVMAAKDEDEQLEAYARTMNTFSARRLAKPLAQSEYEARLNEEREAAVAQANVNRLRTSAAPSIGITASAVANDEPDFRSDYQGWLRWNDAQKARRR